MQLMPALVCLCTQVHSMLSELGPESHVNPDMPANLIKTSTKSG